MFQTIDIENFGSYKNFTWKNHVTIKGSTTTFKRLNIIYGRNYSGKTTLSKIFRSLELGSLPEKYDRPDFHIKGQNISAKHNDLTSHGRDVRVYNKDFVQSNLSFLHDYADGKIKTFAIVGDDNNKIISEIASLRLELGSVEGGAGATFRSHSAYQDYLTAIGRANTAKDAISTRLKRFASDEIKRDRVIGKPVYDITHLEKDISRIVNEQIPPLTEDEDQSLQLTLKQEALSSIPTPNRFKSKIVSIRDKAYPLINKPVTPSIPLVDLLEDVSLQNWVKQGIDHHHDKKRTSCAFCRQDLPGNLWAILGNHFNEESIKLSEEINSCISAIDTELLTIRSPELKAESFYPADRKAFTDAIATLNGGVDQYRSELCAIKDALNIRLGSIFTPGTPPTKTFDPLILPAAEKALDDAINTSNARTVSLESDKELARERLRINKINKYINDVQLFDLRAEATELQEVANQGKRLHLDTKHEELAITNNIQALEIALKDERKGAERVNSLLAHFFGHTGLKLEAEDGEDKAVRFIIKRGIVPAYNLSEGECSLISFAYFVALLESAENSGKELTIYIDDPISSLDNNHIFFIFSLIETLIAQPAKNDDNSNRFKYRQLFISTHNLDFLKYLQSLSRPDNKNNGGSAHFIIERHGDNSSRIRCMPKYLQNHATEFNYLFEQIHDCSLEETADNHELFYSFGNNLRKFLEAYLFFKYPVKHGDKDTMTRIRQFFGGDELATCLANRINNELSHLQDNFERCMKPIDIPEIQKLSRFILATIERRDPEQYAALLQSIGR